jgi:hypothetical protein
LMRPRMLRLRSRLGPRCGSAFCPICVRIFRTDSQIPSRPKKCIHVSDRFRTAHDQWAVEKVLSCRTCLMLLKLSKTVAECRKRMSAAEPQQSYCDLRGGSGWGVLCWRRQRRRKAP